MRSIDTHLEIEIPTEFAYNPIPERRLESEKIEDYVKAKLPDMGKGRIEELRTQIKDYYLGRFRRPKTAKYGSLSKAFSEQQLTMFLHQVSNPKHALLFKMQAGLGLRIGEAVKVNIRDINLESREIKIHTEKARQLDSLIIAIPLFRELLEFIKANSAQIEQNDGYIFFREAKFSPRKEPYLEVNYIRRMFREYAEQAGLDEVYDVSEERDGRAPHKLHLLTTHSLRHYAITKFARSTNGNVVLTSRFARHRDMSTTSRYISTDKRELYEVIDAISISEATLLKRKLSMSSSESGIK